MAELSPTTLPYRVYARNESLALAAELEALTEFTARLAFNDVGGWTLTIPATAPGAETLSTVGSLRGVVVLDEAGRTVFSGPLTSIERIGSGGDDDVLNLSGSDDNALLARRWARPNIAGPPYATAYDVRTGLADQVMAEYVTGNVGPGAAAAGWPERAIPGLIVPGTSGLGTTITGRARFDNLLELLQSLAAAGGGLRFSMRQRDVINNQLEFVVTKPVDKSGLLTFDPALGNLSSRSHRESSPAANYVIAAGGGEGQRRIFAERGDSTSISRYGLRETFVDARDTDSTGILGQRIDETLAESKESISVEVDAIDTEGVRFGRDYQLGDIVSTRVGTIETVGYVSAITLTITRETASDGGIGMVQPTITTLGVIREAAGEGGAISHSGGLAGWLSRNSENETIGTVKLWTGTVASIPARWQLMDGTNGTTDMRGRFLVGADGDAGGPTSYPLFAVGGSPTASDHQHGPGTLAFAHDHALPNHLHGAGYIGNGTATASGEATNSIPHGPGPSSTSVNPTNHTHPLSITITGNSGNPLTLPQTGGAANITASGLTGAAGAGGDNRPPYKALLFIQRISS